MSVSVSQRQQPAAVVYSHIIYRCAWLTLATAGHGCPNHGWDPDHEGSRQQPRQNPPSRQNHDRLIIGHQTKGSAACHCHTMAGVRPRLGQQFQVHVVLGSCGRGGNWVIGCKGVEVGVGVEWGGEDVGPRRRASLWLAVALCQSVSGLRLLTNW